MEVTIVDLNKEEKDKLIIFIKDKQASYEHKATNMKKEVKMLHAVKTKVPMKDNKQWAAEIDARIKEYSDILFNMGATVQAFFQLAASVADGSEITVSPSCSSALIDLYTIEKGNNKAQISAKYNYYPRLKKAKEAALYVFSNKIKIIMEASNVKFA